MVVPDSLCPGVGDGGSGRVVNRGKGVMMTGEAATWLVIGCCDGD